MSPASRRRRRWHPDGWREAIWDAVPAGARPERFEARRAFLLGHARPATACSTSAAATARSPPRCSAAGADVTAADVAAEALRRAAASARRAPSSCSCAEDAALPFGAGAFDLVWAGETLEHVADVTGLLSETRRVLRPGGALLVTTPNQPRLVVALEALRGGALERRLDPRSDHLRFFTRRTLRARARGRGLRAGRDRRPPADCPAPAARCTPLAR